MDNGLKITDISIHIVNQSSGRLKAIAKVVLNDCLQLTNMRVYDGSNGLFVSYPIQEGENFQQLFYPVNKEFREYVEMEVICAYGKQAEMIV